MGREISLKPRKVRVEAPRELVFEVVASAGKTLEREGNEKLVEFETRFRKKIIKTIERVTLEPPARIRYRWVEGLLDDVEEAIAFEAPSPLVTLMTYSGRIGVGDGLWGRFKTLLFVRPIFDRLVREHLVEAKRIAEKRAERSRLHPRTPPASNT